MRRHSQSGFSPGGRIPWRNLVVLLAVLAISVSVATRTFHGFSLDHPSVQADASHAMRQHLAADAFVLTHSVSSLGAMLIPAAASPVSPSEDLVHRFELTESLYNRPPPSISLL